MSDKELHLLKEEVRALRADIEDLKKICARMDSHITFVENTYDTLKTPITYMSTYFDNFPSLEFN